MLDTKYAALIDMIREAGHVQLSDENKQQLRELIALGFVEQFQLPNSSRKYFRLTPTAI